MQDAQIARRLWRNHGNITAETERNEKSPIINKSPRASTGARAKGSKGED